MECQMIFDYLDQLYQKTQDPRLSDDKVRSEIKEQVKKSCDITSMTEDDLLKRLDFKPNDLTIEALESFLAELRSVIWLHIFGFSEIEPLQAKKTLQPDFIAKFNGKKCVIEVFCLTETYGQKKDPKLGCYINFDPQYDGSKFGRDFLSKAQIKKNQLDAIESDIKILLCCDILSC